MHRNKKSLEGYRKMQELADIKARNKVLGIWTATILIVALVTGATPISEDVSLAIKPLTQLIPAIEIWSNHSVNKSAASITYAFMLATSPIAFFVLRRCMVIASRASGFIMTLSALILLWFIFELAFMGRILGDVMSSGESTIYVDGPAKTRALFGSIAGFGIYTAIVGNGFVIMLVALEKSLRKFIRSIDKESN